MRESRRVWIDQFIQPKRIGKIEGVGNMDLKPNPTSKQDPQFILKSRYTKEDIDCLYQAVSSNSISEEEKINILEQAVAPCPETKITIKSKNPNSLLDSGSMVTLMTQSYFEEHLQNSISDTTPGSAEAHQIFTLKGAGENQIPLSKYFSCDISIRGMMIPEVGILVKTDCQLTTSKGIKTRLPVIVGCNLFRLTTFKFIRDYGEEAVKLFECPQYIDPLFFSCILLFYYSKQNHRNAKDGENEGEANGKSGVGKLVRLAPTEYRRKIPLIFKRNTRRKKQDLRVTSLLKKKTL